MMHAFPDRLSRKLVDTLYIEAMLLADEARSYFDRSGRIERDRLAPIDRIAFSCESLRVTTRLMHVIAWLLVRKAVATGEISATQGTAPDRRLGRGPDSEGDMADALPETARELISATTDLYERVLRLDDELGRRDIAVSPARTLMQRLESVF